MEHTTNYSFSNDPYCGSITWFIVCITTAAVTIVGNLLTIMAILLSKKLSSIISNHFIFSLAVSDLFVGLSLPYHMSFYTVQFGKDKLSCLMKLVLISFACASSIVNLVLIATDRYIAIVYPFHYNRRMTRKTAFFLISAGWIVSFTTASIPLFWNEWYDGVVCEYITVIPDDYMNLIIYPIFILIWMIMLLLYLRICREATGHQKRLRNASSVQSISTFKDSKSFQVMLTILGCFTICWLPYFVVTLLARVKNTMLRSAFYYEVAYSLATANSGMNPIIYAWKNTNFRKAFLCIIKCKSPNIGNCQFLTNHVPSKKDDLNQDGVLDNTCKNDVRRRELCKDYVRYNGDVKCKDCGGYNDDGKFNEYVNGNAVVQNRDNVDVAVTLSNSEKKLCNDNVAIEMDSIRTY